MICKWCGESVDPAKGKCGHCGRALPPLSECGGFYNVMPEAKLAALRTGDPVTRQPAVPEKQQMSAPTSAGNLSSAARSGGGQRPPGKRKSLLPGLLAALLGVSLLALILSVVSLASTSARLRKLEDRLAAVEAAPDRPDTPEQPPVPGDPGPDQPTRPTGPDEPPVTAGEPGDPTPSVPEESPAPGEQTPGSTDPDSPEPLDAETARDRIRQGDLTLTYDCASDSWELSCSDSGTDPEELRELGRRLTPFLQARMLDPEEVLACSGDRIAELPWGRTQVLEVSFLEDPNAPESAVPIARLFLSCSTGPNLQLITQLNVPEEGQALLGESGGAAKSSWLIQSAENESNIRLNPIPDSDCLFNLPEAQQGEDTLLTCFCERAARGTIDQQGGSLTLIVRNLPLVILMYEK